MAKADSVLVSYNPIIRAQGSFMLGTMIRPLNEQDDLDIDLVCELTGKGASWTQYDLKHKVGNRLKDHETYKRMLDEEGRRCWTLKYAQESNYHMDILPCLVAKDYKTVMERSFSASLGAIRELDNLAIRITDKESANYRYDPSPENWMKSNPFGYGSGLFNGQQQEIGKNDVAGGIGTSGSEISVQQNSIAKGRADSQATPGHHVCRR
ncbi:MAG: nucleotidyltransferase [Alistipes putredinis]